MYVFICIIINISIKFSSVSDKLKKFQKHYKKSMYYVK